MFCETLIICKVKEPHYYMPNFRSA